MKKSLIAVMFLGMAFLAKAEPSFDELQTLIAQHQYAAAEAGLNTIIQNHPNSAKVFYTLAQAEAGLGKLDKANEALNKARGLEPGLKFVPEKNVRELEQAIKPQVVKILPVEESHFWRNVLIFFFVCLSFFGIWCWWDLRSKEVKEAETELNLSEEDAQRLEQLHKNSYDHASTPGPVMPQAKPMPKVDEPAAVSTKRKYTRHQNTYATPAATQTPPAPIQSSYTPAPPPTTVVNNYGSSNSDGFVTGMLVGEMMSDHHHTTVIERDVVVERPVYVEPAPRYTAPEPTYSAPSRSSSWDDTPSTSSSSSSWDDDSSSRSSSSSSSWSSSDSSSSSSSWDSSSSDSSSSSSWDN